MKDKHPADGWLRSSSYKFADHGTIVTESLSSIFGCRNAPRWESPNIRPDAICVTPPRNRGEKFAGKSYWSVIFGGPLAVAGLEKMIDVDADAEDLTRVDLDLVQVHGRMRTDPEAGLVEVARLEELDDLLSTRCPPGRRPET